MNDLNETIALGDSSGGSRGLNACVTEEMSLGGKYFCKLVGPKEELRAEYLILRQERETYLNAGDQVNADRITALMQEMEEVKWVDDIFNLVTTEGKNDALDKYLAGSAYTAAWYLGIIDSSGYTGVAAGDTAASHAGWTESTAYTEANRPTTAWNAASGGSKALSSAASFSINATATIKGSFLIANNTKGGTTGILYSAGLFSGGDKAVANGDTLNVSYTANA